MLRLSLPQFPAILLLLVTTYSGSCHAWMTEHSHLYYYPPPANTFIPLHRGSSRFFLDTALTEEWDDLLPTGLFHGVTTNPTLLERASQPCTLPNLEKLADKALSMSNEFMCQAWGSTVDELVETGRALAAISPHRVVVKVPVTRIGLEAASRLIRDYQVRVCLTAGYHRNQALAAVAVGAEYLAPYLGRLTDAGKDGKEECLSMLDIVNGLQGDTRILVASIRDADTLAELAAAGMETFTFSPNVARQLLYDPLTEQAAAEFEASARKNQ